MWMLSRLTSNVEYTDASYVVVKYTAQHLQEWIERFARFDLMHSLDPSLRGHEYHTDAASYFAEDERLEDLVDTGNEWTQLTIKPPPLLPLRTDVERVEFIDGVTHLYLLFSAISNVEVFTGTLPQEAVMDLAKTHLTRKQIADAKRRGKDPVFALACARLGGSNG